MDLEATIVDAGISAAEANKTTVIALINNAEGGLVGLLTKAVNGITPHGAVLPLVWDAIKPTVLSELVAAEQAENGSVIFALLDADLHALAKSIGG